MIEFLLLFSLPSHFITIAFRTIANYMMWRVTLQSFAVLGRKWRDLAQEYNKVITGQDREEPRWEQCMASLTGKD